MFPNDESEGQLIEIIRKRCVVFSYFVFLETVLAPEAAIRLMRDDFKHCGKIISLVKARQCINMINFIDDDRHKGFMAGMEYLQSMHSTDRLV